MWRREMESMTSLLRFQRRLVYRMVAARSTLSQFPEHQLFVVADDKSALAMVHAMLMTRGRFIRAPE
jgi:hypothetical protein